MTDISIISTIIKSVLSNNEVPHFSLFFKFYLESSVKQHGISLEIFSSHYNLTFKKSNNF